MKKILIANDLLTGGGVENVLENLVCHLLKQGHKITLMLPSCTEAEVRELFGEGVALYPELRSLTPIQKYSLHWFWDRGLYVLQVLWFPVRLFLQDYDVLIALKEGPTMKQLSGLYAKKKFAWVHTDFQYFHWSKGNFRSSKDERKCMSRFDRVVCVSEAAKASVVHTIGDPGNLCVKYNPINFEKIQEQALLVCPERKPPEQFLFVSIGRLSEQKNYHLLIDVSAELEKKYTFSVWIVGDGPQRQELEEEIQRRSITSVRLLGNQRNPYPFLLQADVFVSSAVTESYGIAVQEALVLGKPVIAVKCPAVEETLDPRFGILVDNTFDTLYAAMENMLSCPELLQKCSDNIANDYKVDQLYEKRLRDICNLWE